MPAITSYLQAFTELFFPRLCKVCGFHLFESEEEVCHKCMRKLPRSGFELIDDNPVSQLFWGRVKLEKASSLYYYRKGEHVQQLMHALKYRGNRDLGHVLGKQLGNVLWQSGYLTGIDCIIPVPLHHIKLRQRGFNQSECIARGLSEVVGLPVLNTCLYRTMHTSSQTRKNRFERWQNVSRIFDVHYPDILMNKHALLIDDVVTTGSTLEACAQALHTVEGCKVSIATLGCAWL